MEIWGCRLQRPYSLGCCLIHHNVDCDYDWR